MSPFLRMIRNEDRAEIYDNPSLAAMIDFKWNAAKNYFLRQVFLYFMFALSYALRSEDVISVYEALGIIEKEHPNPVYLYLIKLCYGRRIIFYWVGLYLLNIERIQIKYNGLKRYLRIYNFFDLFSVILPIIIVSMREYHKAIAIANGKENIFYPENSSLTYKIEDTLLKSFATLIISIELLLLLRHFEKVGAYTYIIVNIFKQVVPFLLFMLLFICGLGFAMFTLLKDAGQMNIQPEANSYDLYSNGKITPFTFIQHINVNSPSDNYYSNLLKSIESVFFWTGGRWDQLDQWDFWPVDIYAIVGNILLVTILQNMLIAIMTGAYDDAKEVSRHAALKYRAEMIADYETIDKPFGNEIGNPRYIYFTGKSDYIEQWLKKSEKARESHKNFLAEIDNNNSWYYNDNSKDNDDKRKNYTHLTQDFHISQSVGKKEEIPLSLYWFVDEDEINNKSKSQLTMMTSSRIQSNNDLQKDNIHDDVKILQDKIQSMEENIKHLISLLQNKQ